MLISQPNRLRFHMPGHKGRALPYPLPWEADTTELPTTDNLYDPTGPLAHAQSEMARVAHAGHTLFLTGGSTAGLLAMILYAVPPGGTLLMGRNAHHAALSACILGDINPVYVWPDVTADGFSYIPSERWEAEIDADAILITAPDYYGTAPHFTKRNKRLLVDQAHGSHWNWWDTPPDAGRQGASLWVQSAHKTLPAPTSAAWLHVAEGEDVDRLRACLRLVQTSSPSFWLMSALDQLRIWMEENTALQDLLQWIPTEWPADIHPAHDAWRSLPLQFDPTRIVLDVTARGFSGFEAAQLLAEQGIDVEMADFRRIVCIATIADRPEDFERLWNELAALPYRKTNVFPCLTLTSPPEVILSPRNAALGPQVRVPLHQATGRIAATVLGVYPPGTPWVVPGELITAEHIEMLLTTHEAGAAYLGVDAHGLCSISTC